MIRKYTFDHTEKSRFFAVSDTHFKHNREFLYVKRGYKSIEEHDEDQIRVWNERVRPQDVVWHHGDAIVGADRDGKQVFENYFNRLNGHIYMLWGNHNAGAKQVFQECVESRLNLKQGEGKEIEVYPVVWNDKVIFVGYNALIKVNYKRGDGWKSQLIHSSHFAHRIWIDAAHGVIALSGHSHGSDRESNPNFLGQKRLDVGIENFGGPVGFDEILEIMSRKTFNQVDHHDVTVNPS